MKLSKDEFAALVQQALEGIPPRFRSHLENVVVDVEPMPSRRVCEEMEIDDPGEILGLYHGTPMTERGMELDMPLPDRITIYQKNVESVCSTREEVVEEIRTTVLHEVGHHFGLDEDDLTELGYD